MQEATRPDSMSPAPAIKVLAGNDRIINLDEMLAHRKQALPRSLRVVLENLVAQALNGADVGDSIEALRHWHAGSDEIAVPLSVSRVLLPDSSGLPALMDLAAARDVLAAKGRAPGAIEPAVPVTLVVDHSLIVDFAGHANARDRNIAEEYRRYA
jgi:aconitate hydratase